jgi:hypothetical protein
MRSNGMVVIGPPMLVGGNWTAPLIGMRCSPVTYVFGELGFVAEALAGGDEVADRVVVAGLGAAGRGLGFA